MQSIRTLLKMVMLSADRHNNDKAVRAATPFRNVFMVPDVRSEKKFPRRTGHSEARKAPAKANKMIPPHLIFVLVLIRKKYFIAVTSLCFICLLLYKGNVGRIEEQKMFFAGKCLKSCFKVGFRM